MAGRRLLVLVEIELDLGAARVEEEQLPDPAAGEPAQFIVDIAALQFLDGAGQILGAERHVVEDAGAVALGQVVAVDYVKYRRVAGIEPPARELEGRAPADLKAAEKIDVEFAGRLEVVDQHGKMVHRRDAHAVSP